MNGTRLGGIKNLPTYEPPTPRTTPEPEDPWYAYPPSFDRQIAHFDPRNFHADYPKRQHPLIKKHETIVFCSEFTSHGVKNSYHTRLSRVEDLC